MDFRRLRRRIRNIGRGNADMGSQGQKMKEDNTPTKTSRRRTPTSHMRLRNETQKKLQRLGSIAKAKRAESKKKTPPGEEGSEKTKPVPPRIPQLKMNSLSIPSKPPAKFRKRQLHKSWLPTHLYHAKRAHITPAAEPLWRFAIPLTPTDKCYRTTHRAASSRGCVAWDTSYMSTLRLEGVEASLLNLLRGLGVEESMLTGKVGGKWRMGTRGWNGWVSERDGGRRLIAKTVIIWCVSNGGNIERPQDDLETKKGKRQVFLRVHPSAFLQVWNEALKVARMQRPPVVAEDLRFEIGSIEIIGPSSTEALVSALSPVAADGGAALSNKSPEAIWPLLRGVTNPASLPQNALLAFEISDPRLRYPPRRVTSPDPPSNDELLQVLSDWPPDTTQRSPLIFDRPARYTACRLLPSQKAINRRKGAALPGTFPDSLPEDPQIPVLLVASRSSFAAGQGSWTVLVPWKCVLPVWYSLLHYPLSCGGNPRFAGLQEKRQIAFEQRAPWFPGDFPGTNAGWEWEVMEREKRKREWEKKPKGKRIEWESVDLGDGKKGEIGVGWACDWERLFQELPVSPDTTHGSLQTKTTTSKSEPDPTLEQSAPPMASRTPPLQVQHIPLVLASTYSSVNLPPPTALTAISLSLLARGCPTACARIYRLPITNSSLRQQWLALAQSIKGSRSSKRQLHRQPPPAPFPKDAAPHEVNAHIAASLLNPPIMTSTAITGKQPPLCAGDAAYPAVPAEEDLIGFVTTGNFNLGEGSASAMGCVALARVVQDEGGKEERRICIVREAGQGLGRLARWEFA